MRIAAGDDEGRERLRRYAARPSVALGRLRDLPDGRVAYRVRWSSGPSGPWRIMTPLECLARLAAIVPPPRYPLVRYHGVLAPASRWRPLVVPRPRDGDRCCGAPSHAAPRQAPHGRRQHDKQREDAQAPPAAAATSGSVNGLLLRLPDPEGRDEPHPNVITVSHWNRLLDGELLARGPKIDWPTLLRRTFGVDPLACPVCAGRLEVLELVTDPATAGALLAGLGLPAGARKAEAGRGSSRAGHARARAP